ncbi:OmpA family protein [Sporocytophaga myxococcoides]|uniref:OmpA family protein n=1 Tax=Sporocytophaga myxococcoides TaxID=153721 RepID=UPI000694575D|nr:OmpA family protein [Sporocytophaga myxococcoides]
MKRNIYSLICIILFFASFTKANGQSRAVKKLEQEATSYYQTEQFQKALVLYERLDSLKPGDAEIPYRIGVCKFNLQHRRESLPYFQRAQNQGYSFLDLNYYLGRISHLNHQFDEAINYYKSYQISLSDTLTAKTKVKDRLPVEEYIEMCQIGKELVKDTLTLEVKNMGPGINSSYPDIVPLTSADGSTLVFTSRRASTTGGKIDIQDNHYYEDIYISYKDSLGKWRTPVDLVSLNTELHDACIGISPDGHKLFLYRSHIGKVRSGSIMVSTLEGNHWSEPILLDESFNNINWEPGATIAIAADEKTIFFSSDRLGGFGGSDIYGVRMDASGKWGQPYNLGRKINSEFDEKPTYLSIDNKTLFFSSNGHKSMGGFDILTSVYDDVNKEWSTPENAGYPINTADDEDNFIWSADGTKGYFSSSRPDSYGESDIYVINRPHPTSNLALVKGTVLDEETGKPVSATISVVNNNNQEKIGFYNSNSLTGQYTLALPHGTNYGITVEANGYMFHSENINIDTKNPFFEITKNIKLESLKAGNSIVLNNMFFDFNKSELKKESKSELERLVTFLKEHPELKIELSGHTDNVGKAKYNKKLSEKRATAVLKYLAEKGIGKRRMVAKGYGSTMPISTNENERGRQLNRRTEMKILDNDMVVLNRYQDIQINYAIQNQAHLNNPPVKEVQSGDVPTKSSPAVGSVLKPKVHFTYNSYQALTEYSTQKVMEVVKMMKEYPKMKIKICAYADPIGSSTYNQQLSEKRAQTIMNFMIKEGIEKDRLTIESLGEQKGVIQSNDKKENLVNRRVEFIVIGE